MIIQSKNVWIAGQFVAAGIEVSSGKIERVLRYNEKTPDRDFGELRIVPGFIDIHTHGAFGFDTNDAEEKGLREWAKRLPNEGVTAFLPTTVTQSEEILTNALKNVAKVKNAGNDGAEILGVHFEGPYLSMQFKGAQPEQFISKPSVRQFKTYQEAACSLIKLISVAPEEDEDFALTRYCSANGVVVSMAHSAATYEQALMGVANGAMSMTHVHNGMTGYNHRAPGLVGAALRIRDIFGEIICDCIHVEPVVINNLFAAKGRDHLVMISDSLNAKGLPKDKYVFGGNAIEIYDDGSAHLENGTLAGSTLKINMGLRNLVERALVPFEAALNSCTINPARLLRVDDRKGRIAANFDADLVVLRDDYSVESAFCKGK